MMKKTVAPKVEFLGHKISRIILGSNPFSGFSHQTKKLDEEMLDFYTAEEIKKAWDEAQNCGINAFCARGDRHILRIMREYYNENRAKEFFWFAQTAPEFASFQSNVSLIVSSKLKPSFIYHHGGQLDILLMEGKKQLVKDHLKMIRDTGYFTGMASHQPQFIEMAEEENWDVDFYLACFFNLTGRGKKELTAIKGSHGEIFDMSDPPKMCEIIRKVKKPCIAYKIFGGGRLCKNRTQTKSAMSFALQNIKKNDLILVGVFQKRTNQIKQDVEILNEIIAENTD
ncbi:MAG: hypothetical protein NC937_04780 [Candidatus Omnitrophica bacterium]|nr:hypothetical protein [Candidatus Omnitrophota bacterium]MCM8825441.1 hypothetical protein [Candidatus Omnitrophota bacterium]